MVTWRFLSDEETVAFRERSTDEAPSVDPLNTAGVYLVSQRSLVNTVRGLEEVPCGWAVKIVESPTVPSEILAFVVSMAIRLNGSEVQVVPGTVVIPFPAEYLTKIMEGERVGADSTST